MNALRLALAWLLAAQPLAAAPRGRVAPVVPVAGPRLVAAPVLPGSRIPGLPELPAGIAGAAIPGAASAAGAFALPGPKLDAPEDGGVSARVAGGFTAALARFSGARATKDLVAYSFTIENWSDQLFDGSLSSDKRAEAAFKLGEAGRPETLKSLALAARLPDATIAAAAQLALEKVAAKHPGRAALAVPAFALHAPRGEPTESQLRDARRPLYQSALKRVILVSSIFLAIELAGSWYTGALALKADAMHLGADLSINAGALLASWIADRPGEKGWFQRNAEALVGLISAVAIGGMAVHMGFEAYERFFSPAAVPGLLTLGLAFAGLASNLISTFMLYRYRDESPSLKGAFLHAALDAIGSMGIIVAGLLIWAFGWTLADPIVSFGIVALVLWAVQGLARSSWAALRGKKQDAHRH